MLLGTTIQNYYTMYMCCLSCSMVCLVVSGVVSLSTSMPSYCMNTVLFMLKVIISGQRMLFLVWVSQR